VYHSIGALRKSVGLAALFLFLTLTFMLLAVGMYRPYSSWDPSVEQHPGNLVQKENVLKAGGYFGIITAAIAYYCGLSEMLTENDIFTIPIGKVPPRRD
jgi:succinate-acetate transporter protein